MRNYGKYTYWMPPLTKWRVHLTLREFLPNFTMFLRALEFLNHMILPSRLTNIIPVPGSISSPEKLQILLSGIYDHLAFNFLASRPVSRSMSMSPTRIGPSTFLVMILPTSRGLGASLTRTLTWVASPVIPVLPTISTTSAGHPPKWTIDIAFVFEFIKGSIDSRFSNN